VWPALWTGYIDSLQDNSRAVYSRFPATDSGHAAKLATGGGPCATLKQRLARQGQAKAFAGPTAIWARSMLDACFGKITCRSRSDADFLGLRRVCIGANNGLSPVDWWRELTQVKADGKESPDKSCNYFV